MSSSRIPLEPVTIASGASASRWVTSDLEYGDALALALYAPAALDAHTYVFEVTQDPTAASPVVRVFQAGDPLADQGPPLANKARTYFDLCTFAAWRIKDQTGTAAADRTWAVDKVATITR